FETAELGRKISKSEYNKNSLILRTELLEIQQKLRKADFPAIVVFGGVDAAGKNETINLLNAWMDPRWIVTRAYGPPSDEEQERPEFWRYWRDLPPSGQIGLFLSAWYSRPVLQRVHGEIGDAEFDKKLDRIHTFEKELADDGAFIIKFWMHLNRAAQKKRFKALEKDPLTNWRVTKGDWENLRRYDEFMAAAERAITRTSTGDAPWQIVEGYDPKYCGLTVAVAIRDALRKHLEEAAVRSKLAAEIKLRETETAPSGDALDDDEQHEATSLKISTGITILSQLDMDQTLPKKEYRRELAKYQAQVHELQRHAVRKGFSVIGVFEGWDAGGKGGAVRRITEALDARDYRVLPFAAPMDEERQHHYLWRFWRHISRAGRVTIFDRSWYGRVLVERVEGFATEAEWRRAYAEINDFEEQLVSHGVLLCKFWLHITPDEQLRRFEERENVAYKRWKLTEEDWRNREKWDLYEEAVNDMVERTSTAYAPWTLVEGNDKRFARIKILSTMCERLREAL
ncbi:MAG: polyphosphate:AMP phosphotransferase, partial [Rhodospirillaceae bacterium]|nr:polyphosphate:AMP phosphotransferase [Rhodospirillaceae bacterium]